ncbi:MAG: hypothetical protein Q9221_008771 [Calogaya cf. arnoldii]
MKEARLLHFSRKDEEPFELSSPARKGLPVHVPLQENFKESKILSDQYETGLLKAITEVVGEGGIMDGWQVNAISKCYKNWDGVKNVNVIVVREKVGEDGLPWKSQATSEWVPTPDSSVVHDS